MLRIGDASPRRKRLPWLVTFLGRRLTLALATLAIFVSMLFMFIQVWVPYTWATQFRIGGVSAYQGALEAAGLDRPLFTRYVDFVQGLAQGDLGTSFYGFSVGEAILAALPVTLTVFMGGAILGWMLGEQLGRLTSWRPRRLVTTGISVVGILSASIFPPFLVFVLVRWLRQPLLDARTAVGLPVDSLDLWRAAVTGDPHAIAPNGVRWLVAIGLTAALVAGLTLRSVGRRRGLTAVEGLALPVTLLAAGTGIWLSGAGRHALDLLYRADMTVTTGRGSPALALVGVALMSIGQVMFMVRAGMDHERSEDYVLTARAKGLRERVVRDRHAARNALAPVLAGSFLAFPTILAGMIIVELELEMTGLSSVLFAAIEFQDIPVIMGVMVVLGVLGIGFRLATDVAIAVLDPRQRRVRV